MAGEEDLGNFFWAGEDSAKFNINELSKRKFPLSCTSTYEKVDLNELTYCTQTFLSECMSVSYCTFI